MKAILPRAIAGAAATFRANASGPWGTQDVIPPPSQVNSSSSTSSGAWAMRISTVLACAEALSGDFRTLPFWAYEGDPQGARQPIAKQPNLITSPFGPDLSCGAGMGQIILSLAMRGNAFLFVVSIGRDGFPDQLLILSPDRVQVRKDSFGRKYFTIGGEDFTTTQIIHLTGLMMPGDVSGVDMLTAQRLLWDMTMKVMQYADGFFGSGGSPSGVIAMPGSGDRKKIREVKAGWAAGNAGVANAHNPAVLFGGATWTPMSVTPENAQFLATRQFNREEICSIFGVPLQRVQVITDNASQGGGKGVDSIDAGYIRHTLLKYAAAVEEAWDGMIRGGTGTFTAFDFDIFLRAAAKERAEIAQIHRVTGVRVRDEIRADEGWAPLPNNEGTDPNSPLNSNASPTGGADNAPATGGQGGTT